MAPTSKMVMSDQDVVPFCSCRSLAIGFMTSSRTNQLRRLPGPKGYASAFRLTHPLTAHPRSPSCFRRTGPEMEAARRGRCGWPSIQVFQSVSSGIRRREPDIACDADTAGIGGCVGDGHCQGRAAALGGPSIPESDQGPRPAAPASVRADGGAQTAGSGARP